MRFVDIEIAEAPATASTTPEDHDGTTTSAYRAATAGSSHLNHISACPASLPIAELTNAVFQVFSAEAKILCPPYRATD